MPICRIIFAAKVLPQVKKIAIVVVAVNLGLNPDFVCTVIVNLKIDYNQYNGNDHWA